MTNPISFNTSSWCISIHTALAGCDSNSFKYTSVQCISIHTALAGCDQAVMYYQQQRPQFQSTQPSQAVTIVKSKHNGKHYLFQSTQPSQAVTSHTIFLMFPQNISIHTALAGCDSNNLQQKQHCSKHNHTQWIYI